MELRREFVALAQQKDANIRQLCRRFGISAPTGYKWLGRYAEARAALDRTVRSRVSGSQPYSPKRKRGS